MSTTDPDASPMHQKKKGGSRLGYQTHYVVDGGKARVILDALVTGAEVNENLPMLEMLFRNCFRWRLRPRSVTGDAAYGTRENLAAVEKAGTAPTPRCPTRANAQACSPRTPSSTTPKRTCTSVLRARSCAARAATVGEGT